MMNKNEFDNDPASFGAVKSIFSTLDRRNKIRRRKPYVPFMIVAALVLLLTGVLWYSYPQETALREAQPVPIVKADARPYKVVPSEPGGMDIPFRDSTVFETLRADSDTREERRIENLLPPAEEPVGREALFAGLKTDIPAEDRGDEPVQAAQTEDNTENNNNAAIIGSPRPADEGAAEPVNMPAVMAARTPQTKPVHDDKEAEAVANGMAKTQPSAGVETYAKNNHTRAAQTGTHYIQLLSLSSDKDARAAWPQMKSTFDTALSGLDYRVQKADLGARGTYYRLQAGPVSEAKAQSVCTAIKKEKPGGCLVVKN